jgi:hypothetical protein
MGKVWERYLPQASSSFYRCSTCNVHLALCDWLISKNFHGRHGQAFLFSNSLNLLLGPLQERILATGLHTVSDCYCCKCNEYIGWKYYFAASQDQKYKEGKIILECGKIVKVCFDEGRMRNDKENQRSRRVVALAEQEEEEDEEDEDGEEEEDEDEEIEPTEEELSETMET